MGFHTSVVHVPELQHCYVIRLKKQTSSSTSNVQYSFVQVRSDRSPKQSIQSSHCLYSHNITNSPWDTTVKELAHYEDFMTFFFAAIANTVFIKQTNGLLWEQFCWKPEVPGFFGETMVKYDDVTGMLQIRPCCWVLKVWPHDYEGGLTVKISNPDPKSPFFWLIITIHKLRTIF